LRFFVDHRQKDWPEWLTLAEFAVNNKAHIAIKVQADKRRKEIKDWKKGDRILLNTKDLVFKERLARKLVD